jgi:nicotinate phosphoribosyltransferase
MALISELYFKIIGTKWEDEKSKEATIFPNEKWENNGWNKNSQRENAILKISDMNNYNANFADFGTRRRRSFKTQDTVIKAFIDYQRDFKKLYPESHRSSFVGTSNVYFAMKYNLKAIGTYPHEWIMGNSVLEGLRNANYYAMHNWVKVYNANLGIALTDTYGTDAFLNNFNLRLSKLYGGVRWDSGDWRVFTDKIIDHYKKLKIDPLSKTIVFSDNLNIEKAVEINNYCKNKIKCSFGIGTFLTNDFQDSPALNMVIKLWSVNNIPVVKLSDSSGKVMGDTDAIRVAKWTFNNTPLD